MDELKQRVLKARTLLGKILALFPETHGSPGTIVRCPSKMGADEAEALRGVVDAMDV